MEQCTIVLFGATGDLARKKLIPALYQLHVKGSIHKRTRIVAIGRRDYTAERLVREYAHDIPHDAFLVPRWREFAKRVSYHNLEFHDRAAYERLAHKIGREERRLFYLATPQDAFPEIIGHLQATGAAIKNPKRGWHRVVFEKPFGSDLKSARALNEEISCLFDEKQIYRIDHYLGKSFVQEIFAIRFANPVFEHLWSAKHIDNVQIVVSETDGVGTRAEYYDGAGAIRDMVQNHLLQILCLVAMEPPSGAGSHAMREEKANVLRLVDHKGAKAIAGQYEGYRREKGVREDSGTETFAALRFEVRSKRWRDVPFYLRTGKRLRHKYAQIAVTFKQASCLLFEKRCPETNVLVIRIQPDEGIKLRINLAEGKEAAVEPREMSFLHEARGFNTPEAYELLLEECIKGDQALFTSWGFVEQSWRIVDGLRTRMGKPLSYEPGGHGPKAALDLLKREGRDWVGNSVIE